MSGLSSIIWLALQASVKISPPWGGASGIFLCNPSKKWEIFLTLSNDRKGFVISREPLSFVERKLDSKEVPVLWLTKIEGENCVYPTRLPYLHQTLVDFMREDDAPKVVLLDGFEYLVLENGFESIFKFLTSLRDYALLNNAVILLPVFGNALDEREYALLNREFPRVHSTGLKKQRLTFFSRKPHPSGREEVRTLEG